MLKARWRAHSCRLVVERAAAGGIPLGVEAGADATGVVCEVGMTGAAALVCGLEVAGTAAESRFTPRIMPLVRMRTRARADGADVWPSKLGISMLSGS